MNGPLRPAVLAMAVLAVALVAGCSTSPVPPPSTGSAAPTDHRHGDPIDAGERPSDEQCDARLRAEQAAAKRIRLELRVEGVATDDATIAAVAADPAAQVGVLGIPLTASEVNAAVAAQMVGGHTVAIDWWAHTGAPERFGGVWIDPPGTDHYVVAVVGGNPDTLALARCLETVDVRYVWANQSFADGQALRSRISADLQAGRLADVGVNGLGYRENEGMVVVGVTNVTPELERILVERYGGPLRLEQQGPIILP